MSLDTGAQSAVSRRQSRKRIASDFEQDFDFTRTLQYMVVRHYIILHRMYSQQPSNSRKSKQKQTQKQQNTHRCKGITNASQISKETTSCTPYSIPVCPFTIIPISHNHSHACHSTDSHPVFCFSCFIIMIRRPACLYPFLFPFPVMHIVVIVVLWFVVGFPVVLHSPLGPY